MAEMKENNIDSIVQLILADYDNGRSIDDVDRELILDKETIIGIIDKLIKIIYPGHFRDNTYRSYNIKHRLAAQVEDVMFLLNRQLTYVFKNYPGFEELTEEQVMALAEEKTTEFFKSIPKIRELLATDIDALYDGDPAAKTRDEIIFCYPGLYAITVFRIAHELFVLNIPMIPRIMTEHAHSLTGIDIHPGATVGKYFFIDHGTGIVVGETTIIGEHVKLYQGVTVGALSTSGGQKLAGKKRHPTLEDYVTVYSGASILGGETIIGEHAVIGGSAFITTSVPAGARVTVKNQELQVKYGTPKIVDLGNNI